MGEELDLPQRREPSALLHSPEELSHLGAAAAAVPEGGSIVEIGTYRGGGTALLCRHRRSPEVAVTSVDINACSEARRQLADRPNLTFIHADSKSAAERWGSAGGGPIDLLFIDDGHRFVNIFEDFNHWVDHVAPGGRIVLHDYDSRIHGGVFYLGVKLFGDTLLRLGLLGQPYHIYSMLSGVKQAATRAVTVAEARFSLVLMAQRIMAVREHYREAIRAFIAGEGDGVPLDGPAATFPAEPVGQPCAAVAHRISKLEFLYVVDHLIRRNPDAKVLDALGLVFPASTAETIALLEGIRGGIKFPDDWQKFDSLSDAAALSHFIVLEEIRLTLLGQLGHGQFWRMVDRSPLFGETISHYGDLPAEPPDRPRRVAVFGATALGERCIAAVRAKGDAVEMVLDNAPPADGALSGIEVRRPAEAVREGDWERIDAVVIATQRWREEMARQLRELGVGVPIHVYP